MPVDLIFGLCLCFLALGRDRPQYFLYPSRRSCEERVHFLPNRRSDLVDFLVEREIGPEDLAEIMDRISETIRDVFEARLDLLRES